MVGIRVRHDIVHRDAGEGGFLRYGINRFFTKFSGRVIDNSAKAQIIRMVIDYAEICHHILDFRTVKETSTADNPVWNPILLQSAFQGVRLCICTVKNGNIFIAAGP